MNYDTKLHKNQSVVQVNIKLCVLLFFFFSNYMQFVYSEVNKENIAEHPL